MNLEVLYQENLELRAKLKLLTDKPLERKKIVHTKADLIFSDYIRKRANYCCERCGKHYPPKQNKWSAMLTQLFTPLLQYSLPS